MTALIPSTKIQSPSFFDTTSTITYWDGKSQPSSGYGGGLPANGPGFDEVIDCLAKLIYSVALTDLGQSSPSNLFTDIPALVEFIHTCNIVSMAIIQRFSHLILTRR
jgi:hypothetical protein